MADEPNQQDAAEELALVLTNHGLQRMTARVLATLLFTEQPTITAGELAASLRASAGSISGAVKMLMSVGLVERVPAPASRRDHYRLRDNAWAVLYTNQNEVIGGHASGRRGGDRSHQERQRGPAQAHGDARLLRLPSRRDSCASWTTGASSPDR